MKHAGVRSTIPVDVVYTRGQYSNRSARPVPRVKPEAAQIAEKSKGCMDVLFGNYGKPDPSIYLVLKILHVAFIYTLKIIF